MVMFIWKPKFKPETAIATTNQKIIDLHVQLLLNQTDRLKQMMASILTDSGLVFQNAYINNLINDQRVEDESDNISRGIRSTPFAPH
jgi:hypothetical protein